MRAEPDRRAGADDLDTHQRLSAAQGRGVSDDNRPRVGQSAQPYVIRTTMIRASVASCISASGRRMAAHNQRVSGTIPVRNSAQRGMRFRLSDVLELFAAELSAEQILEELPDLERADLDACFQYTAQRIDHPVLRAA